MPETDSYGYELDPAPPCNGHHIWEWSSCDDTGDTYACIHCEAAEHRPYS